MYEQVPTAAESPQRGRPRVRGAKRRALQPYRRRAQQRTLRVRTYGKTLMLMAFVGVVIPSSRLGNNPLRVIIFPQRSRGTNGAERNLGDDLFSLGIDLIWRNHFQPRQMTGNLAEFLQITGDDRCPNLPCRQRDQQVIEGL